MTRLFPTILALTLVAGLPLAAQAGGFEITGSNGGTVAGSFSCLWTKGQPTKGVLACQSQSLVTGPNGATGSRVRTSTASNGTLDSTISGTRVTGRDFSRTVSRQR